MPKNQDVKIWTFKRDQSVAQYSESLNTLVKHLGIDAILLIDGGVETAVQRVSGTPPMPRDNTHDVAMTALAGQLLGKKLIYLEAGSGAQQPVPLEMITAVTQILKIPIIVGGGIRSWSQIQAAYQAGATLVVIGTAFEENPEFFINS